MRQAHMPAALQARSAQLYAFNAGNTASPLPRINQLILLASPAGSNDGLEPLIGQGLRSWLVLARFGHSDRHVDAVVNALHAAGAHVVAPVILPTWESE